MSITKQISTFTKAFKDTGNIATWAILYKGEHDFNVRTDDIERWFNEWVTYHQKTKEIDNYRWRVLPDNEQPILHSQS